MPAAKTASQKHREEASLYNANMNAAVQFMSLEECFDYEAFDSSSVGDLDV